MFAHTGRLAPAFCLLLLLPAAGSARESDAPETPARLLWREGQAALLDNRPEDAVALFERSLRLDPNLADNHLSLAAAWLARDDEAKACTALERYLQARPGHLAIRLHHADLLLHLKRPTQAREEYERFAAEAQGQEAAAGDMLVHCHARLMELAMAAGDDHGEHLHRGISLLLLARQQRQLGATSGTPTAEALLCQAAGEFAEAHLEQPDEARACWYLYEVWTELGQAQPASRWLRAAADAAPFGQLTATERARLAVAVRQLRSESARK
jgi:tetratricopeptide (TPR) repeat protein